SDVCSSDLVVDVPLLSDSGMDTASLNVGVHPECLSVRCRDGGEPIADVFHCDQMPLEERLQIGGDDRGEQPLVHDLLQVPCLPRSEERRVGLLHMEGDLVLESVVVDDYR